MTPRGMFLHTLLSCKRSLAEKKRLIYSVAPLRQCFHSPLLLLNDFVAFNRIQLVLVGLSPVGMDIIILHRENQRQAQENDENNLLYS